MRVKKHITQNGITLWFCTGCEQYLPDSAFYHDKRQPICKITTKCKKCHVQNSIRTRDKDKKKKTNREYMRRARMNDPEKFRERARIVSRTRIKDMVKVKARSILNHFVRDKKIIKPIVCSRCGKIDRITAHHDDYSKPLEVIWLCYECHSNH